MLRLCAVILALLLLASVVIAWEGGRTGVGTRVTTRTSGGASPSLQYHKLLIDGASNYLLIDGAGHYLKIDGA